MIRFVATRAVLCVVLVRVRLRQVTHCCAVAALYAAGELTAWYIP